MVIWSGYTLCFFTVFPNYEYLYRNLNLALDWHLVRYAHLDGWKYGRIYPTDTNDTRHESINTTFEVHCRR